MKAAEQAATHSAVAPPPRMRPWQRYGWSGLATRAVRKLVRRLFFNRNIVFVHAGKPPDLRARVPLEMAVYDTLTAVPAAYLEVLQRELDVHFISVAKREFAQQGRLWIGRVNGEVAAYQWVRLGCHIPHWFVALEPQDAVIFNTATCAAFRGQGIAPAMMVQIIREIAAGGGRTYIDCKVWNRPAIRGVEKSGFKQIGVFAPLRAVPV